MQSQNQRASFTCYSLRSRNEKIQNPQSSAYKSIACILCLTTNRAAILSLQSLFTMRAFHPLLKESKCLPIQPSSILKALHLASKHVNKRGALTTSVQKEQEATAYLIWKNPIYIFAPFQGSCLPLSSCNIRARHLWRQARTFWGWHLPRKNVQYLIGGALLKKECCLQE